MAIYGLNKNADFKNTCDSAFRIYGEILTDIHNGKETEFIKILQLKGLTFDMLAMQRLTQEEAYERDMYVKKYIGFMDTIKALDQLKENEDI